MQRESMFLALLMSFFIPGLGLLKIGQVREFIAYLGALIMWVAFSFVTMGLAIFFYPVIWGMGMLHTGLAVRSHNKRAAHEAYRHEEQLEALRETVRETAQPR